jgi:hypothetical protein
MAGMRGWFPGLVSPPRTWKGILPLDFRMLHAASTFLPHLPGGFDDPVRSPAWRPDLSSEALPSGPAPPVSRVAWLFSQPSFCLAISTTSLAPCSNVAIPAMAFESYARRSIALMDSISSRRSSSTSVRSRRALARTTRRSTRREPSRRSLPIALAAATSRGSCGIARTHAPPVPATGRGRTQTCRSADVRFLPCSGLALWMLGAPPPDPKRVNLRSAQSSSQEPPRTARTLEPFVLP